MARKLKLLLSMLLVLPLSACDLHIWGWGADEIRVDRRVILDARSVGKVVATATSMAISQDHPVMAEIWVVDLQSGSNERALNRAIARLQARDWQIYAQKPPRGASMQSSEFQDTQILLTPIEYYAYDGNDEPELAAVIEAARKRLKPFIVIEASRLDV